MRQLRGELKAAAAAQRALQDMVRKLAVQNEELVIAKNAMLSDLMASQTNVRLIWQPFAADSLAFMAHFLKLVYDLAAGPIPLAAPLQVDDDVQSLRDECARLRGALEKRDTTITDLRACISHLEDSVAQVHCTLCMPT